MHLLQRKYEIVEESCLPQFVVQLEKSHATFGVILSMHWTASLCSELRLLCSDWSIEQSSMVFRRVDDETRKSGVYSIVATGGDYSPSQRKRARLKKSHTQRVGAEGVHMPGE